MDIIFYVMPDDNGILQQIPDLTDCFLIFDAIVVLLPRNPRVHILYCMRTCCISVSRGLISLLKRTLHELSSSVVTIAKCPTLGVSLLFVLSYTETNSPSSPSTRRVCVDSKGEGERGGGGGDGCKWGGSGGCERGGGGGDGCKWGGGGGGRGI